MALIAPAPELRRAGARLPGGELAVRVQEMVLRRCLPEEVVALELGQVASRRAACRCRLVQAPERAQRIVVALEAR